VQLHNALIVSIFDPSTHSVTALTPPPDVPKRPPRKPRRVLPYQGDPEEPLTLRSSRLKRWAVGIGRRERDRIRNLKPVALTSKRQPRPEVDEIANERGVGLLPERGGVCFITPLPPTEIVSDLQQSFLAVDLQFNWHHLHEASFYNISPTGLISSALNITLTRRLRTWQLSCHLLLR
jgi:hypothetical protein